MKKIYIITGNDEWLTYVVIKKLISKYQINLIKTGSKNFNINKTIKLVILIGIIRTFKILFKKIRNQNIKIININKNQLETFLKKLIKIKFF